MPREGRQGGSGITRRVSGIVARRHDYPSKQAERVTIHLKQRRQTDQVSTVADSVIVDFN